MSAASISKIHVTNSTGLSLNDRFTTISRPEQVAIRRRSTSRGRSQTRSLAPVERAASVANRRLLQQLARRHKMQAALKLKRRSVRTAGGIATKRGSLKALRVGANGRPIRTNSLTNVATMKADFITNNNNNNQRRPLRRSNSSTNIANRLGARRPLVGGAAQRVEKRRQERTRGGGGNRFRGRIAPQAPATVRGAVQQRRGRSRSRSRIEPINNVRDRSQSRGRSQIRGRSQSRGRDQNRRRSLSRGGRPVATAAAAGNVRRGRSRSRGRRDISANAVPIKARLGVRPGANSANNAAADGRRRPRNGRNRNTSTTRGVAEGRVQKRNIARNGAGGGRAAAAGVQNAGGAGGRTGRSRTRGNVGNASAGRSRSRTRKGQVGQGQQQQQPQRSGNLARGRGRSQQRINRGGRGAPQRNNGKSNAGSNGQQQQRRGRSRSRGGQRQGRNPRNQGSKQQSVNKDDLDKELDQYMATTKTEHDMDYLLK